MMWKMTKTVLDGLVAHAGQEAPLEACGYLAARQGVICRHYPLTNLDRAGDHFSMDPAEQFAAVREMRQQGLVPAAVYHSHPCTPARPSAEDIRLAHDPEMRHVIVSLLAPAAAVKMFCINNGEVAEELFEVVADGEEQTALAAEAKVTEDLRGVSCPMNLVRTKVALSRVERGRVVEIILDDGPPVRNVPEAARREGHEIVAQQGLADGAWAVLIRKG